MKEITNYFEVENILNEISKMDTRDLFLKNML